jgi:hypothetical protein
LSSSYVTVNLNVPRVPLPEVAVTKSLLNTLPEASFSS